MEWEYICKSAKPAEWQRWLNQWRHQYEIEILQMAISDYNVVMVVRRKKERNESYD